MCYVDSEVFFISDYSQDPRSYECPLNKGKTVLPL